MKKILVLISFIFICVSIAHYSNAQELLQEEESMYRARVVKVLSEEVGEVSGTGLTHTTQEILVTFLNGDREGESQALTNDFVGLDVGDVVFIHYAKDLNGFERYTVAEPDRRGVLVLFSALFVITFLLFAGWRGILPIISLAGVFFVIFYMLVPLLLSGAPPVLVSLIFSIIIMALVMFVTHGFAPSTVAAYLGTVTTLFATTFLASLAVGAAKLSGYADDAAVYLNLNTGGELNLSGILLGSIIIGAIGVLDDIAITQTALTAELKLANKNLSRKEIFSSALRVGREHISALVNTLALAYAGASLPLLLLFSLSDVSPLLLINREVFAVEIIRTVVGSIGLVLAVPLTTWFALIMIHKKDASIEAHAHHHH